MMKQLETEQNTKEEHLMCREVFVEEVPVGNSLNKRPEARVCEISRNSAWLELDWWGGELGEPGK